MDQKKYASDNKFNFPNLVVQLQMMKSGGQVELCTLGIC